MLQPETLESLWPSSTSRDANGELALGGVAVSRLLDAYGSPLYVLDEDEFKQRCRTWRHAFPAPARVYYGGKAFLCRTLVAWLAEEGLGLDVCSRGELAVAASGNFPTSQMVLHGNNKTTETLRIAVDMHVGRIVIDSFDEIDRLADVVDETGATQEVMVRVTPGVETDTHSHLSTGVDDQKFGFSISTGVALEAVQRIAARPSLKLVGIHSHIGSQLFDVRTFGVAAERVASFVRSTIPSLGPDFRELNMGGGVAARYVDTDPPSIAPSLLYETLWRALSKQLGNDLSHYVLSVEPGRSVVAPSTTMLYTVGTVKRQPRIRKYISVDGGMTDNIRPALYGAKYTAELANRRNDGVMELATIVGSACETGDVLIRDINLPADISPGDVLAVPVSGAYQRSMGSNFNWMPRPAVIAVSNAHSRLLLRGETLDDLLALDVTPEV